MALLNATGYGLAEPVSSWLRPLETTNNNHILILDASNIAHTNRLSMRPVSQPKHRRPNGKPASNGSPSSHQQHFKADDSITSSSSSLSSPPSSEDNQDTSNMDATPQYSPPASAQPTPETGNHNNRQSPLGMVILAAVGHAGGLACDSGSGSGNAKGSSVSSSLCASVRAKSDKNRFILAGVALLLVGSAMGTM